MSEDLMDAFQRHEAANLESDPRSDLKEDSDLWREVLVEARRIDAEPEGPDTLRGLLHGLRCGGSRLEWKENHLWLNYQALLDTWDEDELRNDWLMPHAAKIKSVFSAVETEIGNSGIRRD